MSVKIKQAIENSLLSIDQKTFDENTIRTLLITSREYLKYDSLIRELAHFIAHPNRNQGIFHKKVNNRYAKYKLVQDQVLKYDSEHIRKNITTEDELSDFMLAGVGVNQIEAKLFKILYQDGLDDISEEHLIKYTGFSKVDAANALKDNYTLRDNYYFLNVLSTERAISLVKMLPEDDELNLTIKEASEVVSKVRNTIDALQKVIRGFIQFNSVFDREILSEEFQICFTEVLQKFEIDNRYLVSINENIDDILLCLMTLLHDSKFIFYDKSEASIRLSVCFENISDPEKQSQLGSMYENGVLGLYLTCETSEGKNLSFPLFVSNLNIKNYISTTEFIESKIQSSLEEIPWITAMRIDDKLKLVK